jgi:hypothetical protein
VEGRNFQSGVWPPKGSHIRMSAPLGAEQVKHALDDQTSTISDPVLKIEPVVEGRASAIPRVHSPPKRRVHGRLGLDTRERVPPFSIILIPDLTHGRTIRHLPLLLTRV